ncbi:uncharacterized protein LOC144916573 [Branchiostoma floridae x Branchiostoma belcheri]
MAEATSSRSDLYLRIDQDLDDDEKGDLRNYVAGKKLLPSGRLRGMGPHQIFMKLEHNRKLKTGDLSLLEDLMKKIGREDFAEEAKRIAEEERKDSRNLSERVSDTDEQRAPNVSTDDRDNIYYKFVERSEKVFHKEVLQDPEKFTLAVETFKLHADTVLGTSESDSGDSDIQKISRKAKLTIRRKVKNEIVRVDDHLFTDQILSDLSKYNLLVRCFNRFGAILKRATRGCVLCYIEFENGSCFKTFIHAYKDGSLSEHMTQELITEDIRAAEGGDLYVHVTLQEDYEEEGSDSTSVTSEEASEKVHSVDKELGTLNIMATTRNNSSKDTEEKKEEAREVSPAKGQWLARKKELRRLQKRLEDTNRRELKEAKRQPEAAKRQAAEEAAKRQAVEDEAKIQAAMAEAVRQAQRAADERQAEAAKRQAEAAKRQAAEEEAKRQAAVAEAARQSQRAAEKRARRKRHYSCHTQ